MDVVNVVSYVSFGNYFRGHNRISTGDYKFIELNSEGPAVPANEIIAPTRQSKSRRERVEPV